jgi:hypothetical protein
MRATEAGSRRASGHRIENAPLSEYQMFRFDPRYTVARWRDEHFIASKLSSIKPVESSVFQLGGDDLSGKVNLNVEPLPTSLSTQIFPPCSPTNFLAKVNPSPVPYCERNRATREREALPRAAAKWLGPSLSAQKITLLLNFTPSSCANLLAYWTLSPIICSLLSTKQNLSRNRVRKRCFFSSPGKKGV